MREAEIRRAHRLAKKREIDRAALSGSPPTRRLLTPYVADPSSTDVTRRTRRVDVPGVNKRRVGGISGASGSAL